MLATLSDKLKVNFKDHVRPFQILCTSGSSQHASSDQPSYLLVVNSQLHAKVNIPCLLQANRCAAYSWEQLRLRCTNPHCSLRPEQEPAKGKDEEVNAEMGADDMEAGGHVEMEIEEKQTAPEDEVQVQTNNEDQQADSDFRRNIWVFSRPMARYEQILTEIGKPVLANTLESYFCCRKLLLPATCYLLTVGLTSSSYFVLQAF